MLLFTFLLLLLIIRCMLTQTFCSFSVMTSSFRINNRENQRSFATRRITRELSIDIFLADAALYHTYYTCLPLHHKPLSSQNTTTDMMNKIMLLLLL
jgi:hypothetical protein